MSEPQLNGVARPAADGASLKELAWLFLRLGSTGFGGPAVHIAMMEQEVVGRRRWLTRDQFLDYVGAVNLIPGPNSTELAIHIGHARAGWRGLLVAGTCFIVPAMLIISAVAWAYVTYGKLPDVARVLYGVKPVVMSIVLMALWNLGRTAIKTPPLGFLAAAAMIAVAAGVHELAALAGAGLLMGMWRAARRASLRRSTLVLLATMSASPLAHQMTSETPFALQTLFAVFAKAGAMLFGSGYVLLAFLRADLVERLRWLSETQLLDAIAIGQMMPGPVFTSATFIGYLLGGPSAAAVATLAIFLPAFVLVALSGPLIPRIRRSAVAGAVLDGVNAASFALMAVVSWHLARAAFVDLWTVALGAVTLGLLLRGRLNSAWLIAAGGIVGWVWS